MVLFLVVTISILNHNNIKISVAKRLFVYTPWLKDISDLQNNANQYVLPMVYLIQTGVATTWHGFYDLCNCMIVIVL